jgi:hypothetical protein
MSLSCSRRRNSALGPRDSSHGASHRTSASGHSAPRTGWMPRTQLPGDGRPGGVHHVRPRMIMSWRQPVGDPARRRSGGGGRASRHRVGRLGGVGHVLTLRAARLRVLSGELPAISPVPRPRPLVPVGTSGELPSRAIAEPVPGAHAAIRARERTVRRRQMFSHLRLGGPRRHQQAAVPVIAVRVCRYGPKAACVMTFAPTCAVGEGLRFDSVMGLPARATIQ